MKTEVLRARGLCKTVNGTSLLEGVNFNIFPGELVAVIGLQYSGKTMLARILSGAERPDAGVLLVEDEPQIFSGIADAQRAGIYCMSKELQLIRSMSIAENLFVINGNNSMKGAFSARKHVAMARQVLENFGLDFDPRAKVREFPRPQQRMIEFVKIALQKPRLIITTGDNDYELRDAMAFRDLFQKLLGMGVSILTIGNKLDHMILECDRVYPLRDGIFGKAIRKAEYSHEMLFRALTGQELPTVDNTAAGRTQDSGAQELLAAEGLTMRQGEKGLSFRLHKGEVLALVIPDSVRARDTAYALFGETRPASGWLLVEGHPVRLKDAGDALERGIVLVTNDVRDGGVFPALSVAENISLFALAREHHRWGIPPRRIAAYMAKRMEDHYGICCPDDRVALGQAGLSRAAWQKISIARWAPTKQKIYIFLNPFAEVDENSAAELTSIIRGLAAEGAGVLIVSTGGYKLRQLCDSFVFAGTEEQR